MFKLDLHTHSILSPDGGISESEYEKALHSRILDVIAITDHNEIYFAEKLHQKLGESIIVGEEITTTKGEIIGLFLNHRIESGLSPEQTIERIHVQGGLVYIPHPFDSLRKGIGEETVLDNLSGIDIFEGFNARLILRWQNKKALDFARVHHLPVGVGSDAHTVSGLGSAYAMIEKPFTKNEALNVLEEVQYITKYQSWMDFFAPKINRTKKVFI